MTWSIRPLDRTRDADELVSLWQRALPTWPIRRDRLLAATPGGHVIEHDGQLAGAIAVHPAGGISYVLVDPEMRRQGIGSALHDAAIASLTQHRHAKAVLGSGGRPFVWPGIPRDLPDAECFFADRGWVTRGVSADLTQDLAAYATPPDALDRAAGAGVTFALCRPSDGAELLAYEDREHPDWVVFFREHLASDPATILLGRDSDGSIVASLLMEAPPRYMCHWSTMLGDDAAEIGCVGVAARRNGEGIGTALVALATDHVRVAGGRVAYLSLTVRWSFYARLGYRVWREYLMADRSLSEL